MGSAMGSASGPAHRVHRQPAGRTQTRGRQRGRDRWRRERPCKYRERALQPEPNRRARTARSRRALERHMGRPAHSARAPHPRDHRRRRVRRHPPPTLSAPLRGGERSHRFRPLPKLRVHRDTSIRASTLSNICASATSMTPCVLPMRWPKLFGPWSRSSPSSYLSSRETRCSSPRATCPSPAPSSEVPLRTWCSRISATAGVARPPRFPIVCGPPLSSTSPQPHSRCLWRSPSPVGAKRRRGTPKGGKRRGRKPEGLDPPPRMG